MTNAQTVSQEPHAIRVVHLRGGLRAIDLGNGPVSIEVDPDKVFAEFQRPRYSQLYGMLSHHGMTPVGVDISSHRMQADGLMPPDWRVFVAGKGFYISDVEQDWGNVRNVEGQKDAALVDLSLRFQTYLRLLLLRIRHLSEAYHQALRAKMLSAEAFGGEATPGLFAGAYLTDIEAAIHAFLADASGLRDLIAEALWRLVMKQEDGAVTVLSSFLKKARSHDDPLVAEVVAAGAEGGWLKTLTTLRNAITHVAPLAQSQELHMMDLRQATLGDIAAPILHFPLLTEAGELRARPTLFAGSPREMMQARLEEYRAFVAGSGDALEYCLQTLDRLAHLAARVRVAAGLQAEMMVFDQSNIIGGVTTRWL